MRKYRQDLGVLLWTGYGFVNGFIDNLHIPLRTTSNYSAIADFHTVQITTRYVFSCSGFTSHCLVTANNNGDSSASVTMSLLSGEYPTTELSTEL
jgi:hypothetical protein